MTLTSSTPQTSHPATTTAADDHASTCARRLRIVLRLNALSSAIPGAIMAIAPGAVDELLDTGRPGWIRVVGLALLPFAAFVAWLSTADLRQLQLHTPGIIAGDVGWVVGSIITVALGWYSATGVALVLAMAVVVDVWALLQWRGWRGIRPTP